MATQNTSKKAIVNCLECGAIVAAEATDDGSFVPIGTEDECTCGSSAFRQFR